MKPFHLLALMAVCFFLGRAGAAGPADTVLVPGDPPLTRETVEGYRDLMERILDIRLPAQQRCAHERAFVADWKGQDAAVHRTVLENLAWMRAWEAGTGKLLPADRERQRQNVLFNLLRDLSQSRGEGDRLLLRFAEGAHKEFAPLGRGAVHLRQGAIGKAIDELTEAVRLNAQQPVAYLVRGGLFLARQDAAGAIEDAGEVLRLDPNNPEAYVLRGHAHTLKKNHGKAIEDFTEAIRLNPQLVLAYTGRGRTYLDRREFGRAVEDYSAVVRLTPEDPVAYSNRAMAYAWKGDYDRGVEDLHEAIRLNPADRDNLLTALREIEDDALTQLVTRYEAKYGTDGGATGCEGKRSGTPR
jgi:tetratricopeptide (TPR) repeat protein